MPKTARVSIETLVPQNKQQGIFVFSVLPAFKFVMKPTTFENTETYGQYGLEAY